MSDSFISIIGQIITATLIVIATRWLTQAKGTSCPIVQENAHVYTVKWQLRLMGIIVVIFCVSLLLWFWHDFISVSLRGRVLLIIPLSVILIGLWGTYGKVVTDGRGIKKEGLLHSTSLRWEEITAVQLHNRHGGAIEVRTASQKIIIDFRFNALEYLLEEIIRHTKSQPTGKLISDS
jgi:hypothetical protein